MGLFIRMALYVAASFIAGLGWAEYDSGAGTLTINLEQLAIAATSLLTVIGTFLAGRWGKRKGWKT